jgi:hypothetical protein
MGIACKWNWHGTGHQVWYDDSTFETLQSTYPLQFYDDFNGEAGGSVFDGTSIWNVVDVGAATEAIVADSSNGLFRLHLHVTGEAEDAILYHGDNRTFDVGNGLIFETKIDMATLPTLASRGVVGMCGDTDPDKDAILESAWFKWDGSGAILIETDDTTLENTDVATGVTSVAGTPNIFRIDFTTLANVKFFIDGVRVASGTTFNMSNLAAAELIQQPYFSFDKATPNAGLGDMDIDYVKILSNR